MHLRKKGEFQKPAADHEVHVETQDPAAEVKSVDEEPQVQVQLQYSTQNTVPN